MVPSLRFSVAAVWKEHNKCEERAWKGRIGNVAKQASAHLLPPAQSADQRKQEALPEQSARNVALPGKKTCGLRRPWGGGRGGGPARLLQCLDWRAQTRHAQAMHWLAKITGNFYFSLSPKLEQKLLSRHVWTQQTVFGKPSWKNGVHFGQPPLDGLKMDICSLEKICFFRHFFHEGFPLQAFWLQERFSSKTRNNLHPHTMSYIDAEELGLNIKLRVSFSKSSGYSDSLR